MVAERSADVVSPVARDGHVAVGAVLARAFHDDPLWTATFPDRSERPDKLASMFTALSKATVAARGVVDVTPENTGAALWTPPGRDIGLWAMLRSGLGLMRFTMSLPSDERKLMMGVLNQFDDARKVRMPAPHWYLAAVGVDPAHHGQGLGSALLNAGIHRADRDGAPIYLETETENNVLFYERLGFEVIEETVATGLGLPIWLMVRRLGSQSA
jgi:ribosomal protein S18 acetylase RimI-like enzyme